MIQDILTFLWPFWVCFSPSNFKVGKWHLGFFDEIYTPTHRGFDSYYGFLGGGEEHFSQCTLQSKCGITCPTQGDIDLYRNDGPAFGENGTYSDYLFTTEAVKVIEEHNTASPLFLYFAIHNVHRPLQAPPELVDMYPETGYNISTNRRRIFNAMHTAVDFSLSNITQALKDKGIYNNTIILFAADNGGIFNYINLGSSNYPLRGGKFSYFEGGIKAASFIHSPLLPLNVIGTRYKGMLHISDWYVTFCEMAGISPIDDFSDAMVDGVNAWTMIINNSTNRPASLWADRGGLKKNEMIYGIGNGKAGAYRNGRYKLIVGDQMKSYT